MALRARIIRVGSALLVATPALADTYYPRHHYYYHHYHHHAWRPAPYPGYAGYSGYSATRPGGACVKLCSTDLNPCDPFYFKQMDGRCSHGLP